MSLASAFPRNADILSADYLHALFESGTGRHGTPHPLAKTGRLAPCFEGVTSWALHRDLVPPAEQDNDYEGWPPELRAQIRAAMTDWLPARIDFVRAKLSSLLTLDANGCIQVERALLLPDAAFERLLHTPH